MRKVFRLSDNVITSLGFSTEENFKAMVQKRTGIKEHPVNIKGMTSLYTSVVDNAILEEKWDNLHIRDAFTRFEKLAIVSITEALSGTEIDITSKDTIFVLSTTKGNIELIDPAKKGAFEAERVYLWKSAQWMAKHFHISNDPVILSHACISGVSALITAKRLLEQGCYRHAIVCGVDVLSDFVIAGFNSLKALSLLPCRPYDIEHEGLNLGEGAGTIVLTTDEQKIKTQTLFLKGGITSNDANHISGPSRIGEGLYRAITGALQDVNISELAFINMHGTATVFNDDMESVAINRSGLAHIPVNAFKGYFGHTLGAAGVIETALSAKSLLHKIMPATLGFENLGTVEDILVSNESGELTKTFCLKTASGFGGCNAALVMGIKK